MLSFIVPAHQEQALLGSTLRALHDAARALGRSYELIVVDDGSTDRTSQIAREAGARVLRVNYRNIAAVRNAGAAVARGEVLVFVDADTLVPPQTLAAAGQVLGEGVIGGGALPQFSPEDPWAGRAGVAMWHLIARRLNWASGCFLFVRRWAFDAAGGFDQSYYASEEIHLSRALKREGRFVLLGRSVHTSGRKARTFSIWEFLALVLQSLVTGGRSLQNREGLELWYGKRREE